MREVELDASMPVVGRVEGVHDGEMTNLREVGGNERSDGKEIDPEPCEPEDS